MTETNSTTKSNLRLVQPPSPYAPPNVHPSSFSVNLVEPGKANWFKANLHSMRLDVIRRYHADYENQLALYERGDLPLTQADRMEIAEILAVLREHIDECLPVLAAGIGDHDHLSGDKVRQSWPIHLAPSTMQIHFHLCELIHAWNLYPFKRNEAQGVATIDEYAETQGVSRFAFLSKEAIDDFLEIYMLDDFVIECKTNADDQITIEQGLPVYWWLTLANRFNPDAAQAFLNTYRNAMNTLAIVHEERNRALRYDGGKVGFILVDHFSKRETDALNTITAARQALGAPIETKA